MKRVSNSTTFSGGTKIEQLPVAPELFFLFLEKKIQIPVFKTTFFCLFFFNISKCWFLEVAGKQIFEILVCNQTNDMLLGIFSCDRDNDLNYA